MLLTLRRSAPALRRFLAVLSALCVSVALAELMIADACGEAVPQFQSAAVDAGPSGPDAATLDSGTHRERSTVPDGHTIHLCHCGHAHNSTPTNRQHVPEPPHVMHLAFTAQSDRLPPSVVGERQLRPPRSSAPPNRVSLVALL